MTARDEYLPSFLILAPSSPLSLIPTSTTIFFGAFILRPFLSNSSRGRPNLTFLGILVFAPSAHRSPHRALRASRKACLLKLRGTVQRSIFPAGVQRSKITWPRRFMGVYTTRGSERGWNFWSGSEGALFQICSRCLQFSHFPSSDEGDSLESKETFPAHSR